MIMGEPRLNREQAEAIAGELLASERRSRKSGLAEAARVAAALSWCWRCHCAAGFHDQPIMDPHDPRSPLWSFHERR
jgi:hypothetical protein